MSTKIIDVVADNTREAISNAQSYGYIVKRGLMPRRFKVEVADYEMIDGDVCNVDRRHRFAVGDKVRHVDATDDPQNVGVVTELTWRVRQAPELGDNYRKCFPTYTLESPETYDDFAEDVLDTDDLVPYTADKVNA